MNIAKRIATVVLFLPVAEMVSTSRQGIALFDRLGWRMVAMYPYGKRGEGLEAYLYVAPPADG